MKKAVVAALLRRTGANADNVAVRLRDTINNLPTIGEHDGIVQASRETGRLINLAYKESRRRGDSHIASDVMLLVMAEKYREIGDILKQEK